MSATSSGSPGATKDAMAEGAAAAQAIEKLSGVARTLAETQQSQAAKPGGKLPKEVFRPAWSLVNGQIRELQPTQLPSLGWNDFDLRHLDEALDAMQALVDLTGTRVPKRVGKAAWRLIRGQIQAAHEASDLDYLESVLSRAEALGDVLAERPSDKRPRGGAVPKTLLKTLNGAITHQLKRMQIGPEPEALPLDRFVDMPRLGGVLEVAQLVSDISRRRPPRKVAESAWSLVFWQVEGITPHRPPTPSNDPGQARHPGENHPGFAKTA